MKKIFLLIAFILIVALPAYAKQEDGFVKKSSKIIDSEVIRLENIDDDTIIHEALKQNDIKNPLLESKISEYYTYDKGIVRLHFNDYLNLDFGSVGTVNWNIDQRTGDLSTNYKFNTTDFILSGKANDNIDYEAQIFANRNINKETILGNLFVRGKYKNVTAQVGRMRKPFAYEPTFSMYNLDTAVRTQIGSLFKDHRDTGGKILIASKYADLGLGLFANMQKRPFYFGQRGIEFDSSLTLKPLANFKNAGDLKLIGSIATGKRDRSYNNYSAVVKYDYKKFGIMSEFISKEAAFYDEKKANGLYVKSSYFLTDKLQAVLRFDTYNPDVNKSSRRFNEYLAGLNYYLNNKNTMFVLNYIFHDGERKSHRVALQMRYRTW